MTLPRAAPGTRRRWGMALGKAGVPRMLSSRPPLATPKSKVLRLGARARKGLEMMSQKPGALRAALPPASGRLGRSGSRADRWTGQEEGGARRPLNLRLSRLCEHAAQRARVAAAPPRQGGSGTAQAQPPPRRSPADLRSRPPPFGCGSSRGAQPPPFLNFAKCAKMASTRGLERESPEKKKKR